MKPFAIVFPGQGSQSVGMLDAWEDHPVVKNTLEEANAALGENIAALIAQGPSEDLGLTVNTQPAMLIAGVAAYRMWMNEVGVAPQALAGHSLGEYTALVAAGVIEFSDAVKLVRFRAQAMQAAVPVGVGGMAAVLGLGATDVMQICKKVVDESGEPVEAVNFNDVSQTVIAGSKLGIDLACAALKDAGAKRALVLPVSAPFHSSLMKPAAEKLKEKMEGVAFSVPQIAVVNNIDVAECQKPEDIKDALYRQAFGPVRWVEVMGAMKAKGLTQIVECGAGKVLVGLLRRIDSDLVGHTMTSPDTLKSVQEALSE